MLLLLFVWYLLFFLSVLDCFIGSVECLNVDDVFGVSAKLAKSLMFVVVVVVVVFCSFHLCAAFVVRLCFMCAVVLC